MTYKISNKIIHLPYGRQMIIKCRPLVWSSSSQFLLTRATPSQMAFNVPIIPSSISKSARPQSRHLLKACGKKQPTGQNGHSEPCQIRGELSNPTILSSNAICIAILEMHFPNGRGLNQPMCSQAIYRLTTLTWPSSSPFVNVQQYLEV